MTTRHRLAHSRDTKASDWARMAAIMAEGLLLCLLAAGSASSLAAAAEDVPHEAPERVLGEPASGDVRKVADWVAESDDNHSLPFVIVDKVNARAFVFDGHGALLGASPVLLGLSKGDDAPAGIGDRRLSSIRPEERITPAGRFVASIGRNLGGKEVLWVDYKSSVSLHRVVTSNPKENRLQRLATESTLDNRISYGCINVPAIFFDSVVKPSFAGTEGIVYVLPEVKKIDTVFSINQGTAHPSP